MTPLSALNGLGLGFAAVLARAVLAATIATASAGAAADAAHPAVVELFQSQGCSSCPPANANLIALSGRPDLLTLSFGVTYWDQLGWKDTFASPKYTARQRDYARAFHHADVGTPEVVVNGRGDVVGQRREEIESLIRKLDLGNSGPSLAVTSTRVQVGPASGFRREADVLLVRYDPSIEEVPIQRGENGGKTLPHKNVVKDLVRLGVWSGVAQSYAIPVSSVAGLKIAVLLQVRSGGPIIAATRG